MKPRQIEQTAKKYKGAQLLGTLACIGGVIYGFASGTPEGAAIGMLTVLGGICLFILARFLAWWNHG
jgi:ABC-type Mn2+/Zn2+ transport system permease subunit